VADWAGVGASALYLILLTIFAARYKDKRRGLWLGMALALGRARHVATRKAIASSAFLYGFGLVCFAVLLRHATSL
jgi:hypothetical protein